MRRTRWLVLAIILAIVTGIGAKYRSQKHALAAIDAVTFKPAPLPVELNSASEVWHLTEADTKDGKSRTKAEIWAQDFREQSNTGRVDLRGVTLHIPSKKADTYNLVTSAAASYFKGEHRLYSDGDVEITLNLPLEGAPKHVPVSIRASGVNYDTNGKAETDRPCAFSFEHGDGTAVGGSYDPAAHLMFMRSNVAVDWKPAGPHAKPMKIEGGSLEYRESSAEIVLKPWGKMTRDNTIVEGENVLITLKEDEEGHRQIRKIDSVNAHGTDDYPNRKLQYAADHIWVDFNDQGVAQKIIGQGNARLVSNSETTETTVTARYVEMNFDPHGHESILTGVNANGDTVMASRPLPGPNRQPGETHILRSGAIDMKMHENGRDIAGITTHGASSLEFQPNLPEQHHRVLTGDAMQITYGPQNRIESFRSTGIKTVTDPSAAELKRDPKHAVSITASREMLAHFDPKTSKLSTMEQTGDFSYEQGDRKARANKASLDDANNVIVLETSARMWDATGSTSADHIRLDERSGDFVAEGGVTSTRMPDKDQKKNSEMLSGDEPLQAIARKMDSKDHNRKIRYEGDVNMWQGANRIQANVVDLDREKKGLVADGNVVTNLWEQPKEDKKKKGPASPILTVVHSSHLVYTEANRLALYSGGVVLSRPGLDVKSHQLQAFLADSGADSRLDKAFADGAVQIAESSKTGTRTGTADHSEYYTDDNKVILKGGEPKFVQRKLSGEQDAFNGEVLTYYADDDRLVVDGSPAKRGQTRVQRRH